MGRLIEENANFIGEMIDKISMKVTETQEKYIFETIKPYCEYITKQEIAKEELAEALLLRQNYEARLKADMTDILDEIREEIIEKYWDCDICKWKDGYCNKRGSISDILQIIDKYK